MTDELLRLASRSAGETEGIGDALGRRLQARDVVLLRGPLGAGKSIVARGIARALGVKRWRGSPTFALINEYDTAPLMAHVDLYRIAEGDVWDLGLDEYLERRAFLVIEWPERAEQYLTSLDARPPIDISIAVTGETDRELTVRRRDIELHHLLPEFRT